MIYGVQLSESKRDTHRPEDIKEGEGDLHDKLMALIHDEEAYAKACGLSDKELDRQLGEIARDFGLHMDDDRYAIISRHAKEQEEKNNVKEEITLDEDQDFHEEFGVLGFSIDENDMFEAEYQGRKVKLNKPMRGDVKKFKVYVKDPKTGNVKKVNFGHGGTSAKRKTMRIRKSNPKARKSFRARHNCDNPGPKTKARYWSCRKW
jgi:sugar diacid utilization regulator